MSRKTQKLIKDFIEYKNLFAILISSSIFIIANVIIYTWKTSEYVHKIDQTYSAVIEIKEELKIINDVKEKITSLTDRFNDHVAN